MNTQERIKLLSQLGGYFLENGEEWRMIKEKAAEQNPWFIPEFIELSVHNIAKSFLQEKLLQEWVAGYKLPPQNPEEKKVGIVMAGNIPLVGFHDFLCVFVSGHKAVIKPSSKDAVLIKHIGDKLISWNSEACDCISFAENLKGCDAYIAVGSNNTARYFEYYFGKYPNIIRRNHTSVAVIDGTETKEELDLLADDIQLYFGLGCRNVTKFYVPEGYDFLPLLDALKKYEHFLYFHKYKHNYDYQLAMHLVNNKFFMNSGALLLIENPSIFSPVSEVHYTYYTNKQEVNLSLQGNEDIQCIVGHGYIPFGQAQTPSLTDYADDVDTMKFLCDLYAL